MWRAKWWAVGLLAGALGTLVGCIDVICPLFEEKTQVHDYMNVTVKSCHLLIPEGTPVAQVVAYQGHPRTEIGGSDEYPLNDTWRNGSFLPSPEAHAEFFDRLYLQVYYPGWFLFDLGGLCTSVYIALVQDHGPYPEEALEYRLEVSLDGLNFVPVPNDVPLTLYRRGWSAAGENLITSGALPESEPEAEPGGSGSWPDTLNDDWSACWDLLKPSRYLKLIPLSFDPHREPEVDAVKGLDFLAEPQVADAFNYPVGWPRYLNGTGYVTEASDGDRWYNAQDFGVQNPGHGGYHPGEDWNDERGDESDVGAPVFAVANGEVWSIRRIELPDVGYVGKGLALKHTLPDRTEVYSVYIHIQVRDDIEQRFALGLPVFVLRSEQIGTIADISSLFAHLHFEIRTKEMDPNDWYPHDNEKGYYLSEEKLRKDGFTVDPSSFIDAHR